LNTSCINQNITRFIFFVRLGILEFCLLSYC